AEQLADDRLDPRVERLDAHAAVRRFDPHLAPVDDAVQPALLPQVREVGPERAVALRGELEVVRLRQGEESHTEEASRENDNGGPPLGRRRPCLRALASLGPDAMSQL